jgi:hemolysin activation/secretion protein
MCSAAAVVLAVSSASMADAAPEVSSKPAAPANLAPVTAAPANADAANAAPANAAPANTAPQRFDIDEFRVDGADKLPQIDVEEAIYPFLGPSRNAEDVEKARAALEKRYHDQGYQTVNVAVPEQNVASRVVVLRVTEGKVGRLRVTNSRFFDLEKIKKNAPSLKEGGLPNFNEVTKDIVALNQWPDRRVTPALRAGVTPGTVDVDLNVEDKLPLHGSVEYNNRQSPNTTPTRLNATVKYDNLWQLGHSASFSYQVAPERKSDAEVFSGSYLARLTDWTSLLVYGVDSKSDVATVGGMNIVGPGQIVGVRAVITLPARDSFFHSLSFGGDYKHFGQTVDLGTEAFDTPITYYPLNATYGATWQNEGALTQFNLGLTANVRGLGSQYEEFDAKRFNANSSFFHINADLSHTQDLPEGFQLFGRIKGQYADGPLISSEQFSLGGVETVRGYLETEVLGDNGVAGTIEARSPDIGAWLQSNLKDETGQGTARFTVFNEWRLFGFVDGGIATIHDPLAEQQSRFDMWSYGLGTRFKLFNQFNGMVALGLPMVGQGTTLKNDKRVLFSVAGEF